MAVTEAVFFGGAIEYALTGTDVLIDRNYRVHVVTPDAAGRSLKCPDPTNMRARKWFWVLNEGANSFSIKDHNGTSLGSLPAGNAVEVALGVDADGVTKKWSPGRVGTHAIGTYVASGSLTYELVFPTDRINVNLYDEAVAQGYDGTSVVTVNVTIESGVSIGSSAVATPSMRTGSFPAGTVINIVNLGNIDGASGRGGNGYDWNGPTAVEGGEAGGNAFTADVVCNFDNTNGKIRGGGGGGGGGGANTSGGSAHGGGGGGGQGRGGGRAGGPTDPGNNGYVAAGYGNPSGPGAGGTGGNYSSPPNPEGTTGGTGGVWGGAGAAGAQGTPINIPISDAGAGGAGGSATEGDSNITFSATGTIEGARNG